MGKVSESAAIRIDALLPRRRAEARSDLPEVRATRDPAGSGDPCNGDARHRIVARCDREPNRPRKNCHCGGNGTKGSRMEGRWTGNERGKKEGSNVFSAREFNHFCAETVPLYAPLCYPLPSEQERIENSIKISLSSSRFARSAFITSKRKERSRVNGKGRQTSVQISTRAFRSREDRNAHKSSGRIPVYVTPPVPSSAIGPPMRGKYRPPLCRARVLPRMDNSIPATLGRDAYRLLSAKNTRKAPLRAASLLSQRQSAPASIVSRPASRIRTHLRSLSSLRDTSRLANAERKKRETQK